MEKVLFFPETHRYIRESDGCRLMSGTHVKDLFDTVDWVHNVRKSAAKRYLKSKYDGLKDDWQKQGRHILDPDFIEYLMPFMDAETFDQMCLDVRKEWDGEGTWTSERGTANHAAEEQKSIDLGYSVNLINGLEYPTQPHGKKSDGTNSSIAECICDYEPGFYSEILLWHFFPNKIFSKSLGEEICGICGQADKGYLEPDCSYVGDYKYPKKPLDDYAYKYPNHGFEMHSGPWSDWVHTRTSGYRIQLNIYGWMLDQHGLPPKGLWLESHGKVIKAQYEGERVQQAVEQIQLLGL